MSNAVKLNRSLKHRHTLRLRKQTIMDYGIRVPVLSCRGCYLRSSGLCICRAWTPASTPRPKQDAFRTPQRLKNMHSFLALSEAERLGQKGKTLNISTRRFGYSLLFPLGAFHASASLSCRLKGEVGWITHQGASYNTSSDFFVAERQRRRHSDFHRREKFPQPHLGETPKVPFNHQRREPGTSIDTPRFGGVF